VYQEWMMSVGEWVIFVVGDVSP